jgi:adenine phosphoribosyltransferase
MRAPSDGRSTSSCIPTRAAGLDKVAGIEARGFIWGRRRAPALGRLRADPQEGKLPHETVRVAYSLEYGVDEMENPHRRIGQSRARDSGRRSDRHRGTRGRGRQPAAPDRRRRDCRCFVIDLPDLGGADKLRAIGVNVRTLIGFEGH